MLLVFYQAPNPARSSTHTWLKSRVGSSHMFNNGSASELHEPILWTWICKRERQHSVSLLEQYSPCSDGAGRSQYQSRETVPVLQLCSWNDLVQNLQPKLLKGHIEETNQLNVTFTFYQTRWVWFSFPFSNYSWYKCVRYHSVCG